MILEKCIVYWKYILKTWRGVSFKPGKWYNEICIYKDSTLWLHTGQIGKERLRERKELMPGDEEQGVTQESGLMVSHISFLLSCSPSTDSLYICIILIFETDYKTCHDLALGLPFQVLTHLALPISQQTPMSCVSSSILLMLQTPSNLKALTHLVTPA